MQRAGDGRAVTGRAFHAGNGGLAEAAREAGAAAGARASACDRAANLASRPLQSPALPLGQAAPDAKPLVMLERVLQALGPHLAAPAHPFGFSGGPALFRKERLRIGLRTQCPILPGR